MNMDTSSSCKDPNFKNLHDLIGFVFFFFFEIRKESLRNFKFRIY